MTKGEATQTKVHHKGKNDDFLVFVEDPALYNKWKSDKSIPLAHFVSSFNVFVSRKQGTQGNFDTASKTDLAAEFDTEVVDDVIIKILETGSAQTMEMPSRQGVTNDSMNSMKAR